jgi:hypothetical protein
MSDSNPPNTALPTRLISRNQYGLLEDPKIKYVYNEDGLINWRRMIKPEFLVPHKEHFAKKGLPTPSSIEGLSDSEILILLGGLKDLANTRGFSAVHHQTTIQPNHVVSSCSITWIPNYETENRVITFTAIGDACHENTIGFSKNFLGPTAENRAFCRAVRNFLRIHIVSQDEIGGEVSQVEEDAATALLRKTLNLYNITFAMVKEKLIETQFPDAEKFTSISDIPRHKQFDLVESIKRKAAAKGLPTDG